MKTLTLTLELLDETVLSERAATEGGHRSLDFIPGATLLGWAASQLYAQLNKSDAWILFHSGKVRFSNGLPLSDSGYLARPMPLCWHEDKTGSRAVHNHKLNPAHLLNLLHQQSSQGVQPRQLRSGYVADTGEVVKPLRFLRMKTAIDPSQGRAADAQLFGYEALAAGTRFQTKVDADDDVSQELLEGLRDCMKGRVRLGRSRSAQYGGVQASGGDWIAAETDLELQGNLILWLQSDLALINVAGAPTLMPDPQCLGLPAEFAFQPERSFLRFRRYTPYNQHRRGHDLERQVICQGSVLSYRIPTGIDLEQEDIARLRSGLGLYRESGLGQVLINPELLHLEIPHFEPAVAVVSVQPSGKPERPSHPLADWLDAHGAKDQVRSDAQRWAETQVSWLRQYYRQACLYNGLAACQIAGPGRTQWGRVEEIAKQRPTSMLDALFQGADAVCKPKDEDWNTRFGADAGDTYSEWLRQRADEALKFPDASYRLALLADQAQKLVATLAQGDER